MSATATRVTHFRIDGGYLANLSRDFVREGNWERGLKMLTENLDGMTHEIAVSILKGEANLTGSSSDEAGIGLESLSSESEIAVEMQSQLNYLYGPVFRHKGQYYKPYAFVQGWSGEDNKFARDFGRAANIIDGTNTPSKSEASRRSLYYANRPYDDLLVHLPTGPKSSVDLLCEHTEMPPLWFPVSQERPLDHLKRLWEQSPELFEQRGADESEQAPPKAIMPILGSAFIREESEEPDYAALSTKVKAQAESHGGFFVLPIRPNDDKPLEQKPFVQVPKHPFLLWALRGFDFEAHGKERPHWDPVCPVGLKLPYDDTSHSDWMLGADLDLHEAYGSEQGSIDRIIQESAFSERARLVEEWTGAEFVVLSRGTLSYVCGKVVVAQPHKRVPAGSIALAETAGPEYQLAMESANMEDAYGNRGVLICATGGKLAHLAVVGREHKCTVLMVPNCVKRFATMPLMSVDMAKGKLYQTT